jgi:mycothiol synthase
MPRVEVKRRLEQPDLDALSRLLAIAGDRASAEGNDSDRVLWEQPSGNTCGPFAGVMAWDSGGDHPVGYAQLSREGRAWDLELVLDPTYTGPSVSLAEELATASLDLVRREGGGRVHLWVPDANTVHRHVAEATGLTGRRVLYQMRRPLPVEAEPNLTTRPFRVGVDEDLWLEANRRAFVGDPEQSGWGRHELGCRQAEPWFDAEGFLLHELEGRLAGFCWTKVHHDSRPPLGEIYVLGVDPDFQGLGLGRELAVAGLHLLSGKGLDTAMLYVDAANYRAIRLYKSLGFITQDRKSVV